MIDNLILLLKRVKNCEKALFLLINISENRLFKSECLSNFPEIERKYAKYVHDSILECIKLIEDDRDPT